jgi:hypothetical protein
MAPQTPKSKYWFIILGLLSAAVMVVMAVLGYLLLTLPAPANSVTPTTSRRPALVLPTAVAPTATSGPPPSPLEATFIAEEPVKGFSNCTGYGFGGVVKDVNGRGLAGRQVVVWEDQIGLLGVATTDAGGNYTLQFKGQPAPRKLWVQVYHNDQPASAPVLMETQVDCQHGFQVFQIDWRQTKS